MNNYYSEKQYLFAVDKKDNITGKIEKWETHEKGLLHRGFTVILFFNKQIIYQQRKHLVFDRVYDMSFSSHQIFTDNRPNDDLDPIYESLKREWYIKKGDLIKPPKFLGKIYYQARDPKSSYIEHEIDYIYSTELKKLPKPNLNFAYGFRLYPPFSNLIAPWVKKIIGARFMAGLRPD